MNRCAIADHFDSTTHLMVSCNLFKHENDLKVEKKEKEKIEPSEKNLNKKKCGKKKSLHWLNFFSLIYSLKNFFQFISILS